MPYQFGANYQPTSFTPVGYSEDPLERWGLDPLNRRDAVAQAAWGDTQRFFGEDVSPGQALLGGSSSRQGSRSFLYDPQDVFARQYLYPYITNIAQTYGGRPQDLIAGFSPAQQLGQQLGIGAGLGAQQGAQAGLNAYGQALDPYSSFNPFFQQSLQATLNPFIRNFQQNIIPNIRSQAVGVGQTGGSREGIAQGLASQGLQQQIGDITSQFGQNAYNQGIQSRNLALGLTPQILGAQFLPSQGLRDIGAEQQGLRQQQLQAPLTFASQLQALMGQPITLNESFGRSTQSRGLTQGFQDVFGGSGGGMMGGGLSGMFSDRRLKHSIKKLFTAFGLPVYSFTYIWGQKAIGFMADEVKEKYPDAVFSHNGYDVVNYGGIYERV